LPEFENCQRIQIENLLSRQFELNKSISAIFGNFWQSWQFFDGVRYCPQKGARLPGARFGGLMSGRSSVFLLAFFLLPLLSVHAQITETGAATPTSTPRGPSTPEERQRVLAITQKLEAAPLDETLYKERDWAGTWLLSVPDIRIKSCTALLVDLRRPRYKYLTQLWTQVRIAGTAFHIEHPDKVDDHLGESLAGMRSALKAYSAIVKTDPAARSKALDDLVDQQSKGTLSEWVQERISRCRY
jgi:hypothetical protein